MLEQGMVQRRQGAGSVVVSTRPQARYVHTLSSLSDLFQFALVTTCDMVPGHRVIVGPSHRMALLLSSEPLSLTMVVGLPRSPSRRSSSRATRLPEIEVSKALAGAVVDHHQDAQIRQMIGKNALRGVLVKASHVQPRCGPNRLGARDRHCATSRSYRSRRSIQSATRNLGSRSPARSARSARQGGRSCQRH